MIRGAAALRIRGAEALRFAHRGASTRAPENTLAAFQEAVTLGVDVLEFDVHLSADGVPVVIHDDTVDRTTDGRGPVADLSFAALRKLDAGSWFARRFRGERLPSLDETLHWARGRVGVNIELKAGRTGAPGALARAVARSIGRARFRGFLLLSSFEPEALRHAREALPKAALGLLASRSARRLRPLHRLLVLHAFHPHARLASKRRIAAAHDLGLAVYVWPVNDLPLLRRLTEWGADGLMSDDPKLFRRLGAQTTRHLDARPSSRPRPSRMGRSRSSRG